MHALADIPDQTLEDGAFDDGLAVARAMLKEPAIPVARVARRVRLSPATCHACFPAARTRSLA